MVNIERLQGWSGVIYMDTMYVATFVDGVRTVVGTVTSKDSGSDRVEEFESWGRELRRAFPEAEGARLHDPMDNVQVWDEAFHRGWNSPVE